MIGVYAKTQTARSNKTIMAALFRTFEAIRGTWPQGIFSSREIKM